MIKWTKPKVHLHSDSVLCLVKMYEHKEANRRWAGLVTDFQLTASYEELLGIDGEPMEFKWNIFPGLTSLEILQKIQNVWEARSRPRCQGPQRKYAGYLSTTSWKLMLSGSRNSRVIREMMRKEKK